MTVLKDLHQKGLRATSRKGSSKSRGKKEKKRLETAS